MESKNVVITGGTRGLGQYLVNKFSQRGFRVFTCARNEPKSNIWTNSINVDFFKTNLSSVEETILFAERIKENLADSKINLLINNAAVPGGGEFKNIEMKDLNNVFQVNVFSPILLVQNLVNYINREGQIINIGSGIINRLNSNKFDYILSKMSLIELTKLLAFELAGKGIKVNCVSPSLFESTFRDQNKYIQKNYDKIIRETPLGKITNLDDIYEAILFLVGSSNITGEVININGGRYLK